MLWIFGLYYRYINDGEEDSGKCPYQSRFPDVFPKDLLGVHLERHLMFQIYLVLGGATIAKTPYRLAPPRMLELST